MLRKGKLMTDTSAWTGALLSSALTEQPSLLLAFYSFGVMLHKRDGERIQEYAVDPAQVALALSAKITFDTGLLGANTLLVRQDGVRKLIAEYRPPGKIGLFLEGSETALRVPLPGLVLIRTTSDDRNPQYYLFAVKRRPTVLTTPLYHAPLPNVFSSGSICWGTVQRPTDVALKSASLAEDWMQLLGSRFGDHAVNGKSITNQRDIREKWIALEASQARCYPTSDLVPLKRTFADILGGSHD